MATARKRTGRKHGLTAEVARTIVDALEAGAFQRDAAHAAGISEATYYRWLQAGAQPDAHPELREFYEAATRARARAKVDALKRVRCAMGDEWRAAAWYLERSYPAEYGRVRVEHSGPDGGPLEFARGTDLTRLSDDELEQLQHLVEKAESDASGR